MRSSRDWLDYERAIRLPTLDEKSGEIMGVVRLHTSPDLPVGEYAILLRSGIKGRSLGWEVHSCSTRPDYRTTTVILTSMLPLTALEYGQTSCACLTISSAIF